MVQADKKKLNRIILSYSKEGNVLTTILEEIQSTFHYIPKEAIEKLSSHLGVPVSQIFHVVTFFKAFSLEPRGRHLVSVCMGTACHVKGAPNVLKKLERDLKIEAGGTTNKREFSLEKVRCVGCCALAPVVRVDEDTFSYMTQARIPGMLKRYKETEKTSRTRRKK